MQFFLSFFWHPLLWLFINRKVAAMSLLVALSPHECEGGAQLWAVECGVQGADAWARGGFSRRRGQSGRG